MRPELARLLALHIGRRRSGPLFVSRQKRADGRPPAFTRQRIGQMARQIARGAGIGERILPTCCATRWPPGCWPSAWTSPTCRSFSGMKTLRPRAFYGRDQRRHAAAQVRPGDRGGRKGPGAADIGGPGRGHRAFAPTCWQNRGVSLHELLVRHLKVAAATKSLVHGPPVECRLQERLARRHAIEGVFRWSPGSSSVNFPALRPSRISAANPVTRSRSDHASQPVASSRHSKYPAVPRRGPGGAGPGPPCRRGRLSSGSAPGISRHGPRAPSSRPCRRGRQNGRARETEPGKGNVRAFGRQARKEP